MIISAPKRNSKILSKRKSELNKIKVKEAEIVEYYLNRLRKEISSEDSVLYARPCRNARISNCNWKNSKPTRPRGRISQPDDFDDDAIGSELKAERKDQIIQHIDKLEEEIRSETLTYNQYHQK